MFIYSIIRSDLACVTASRQKWPQRICLKKTQMFLIFFAQILKTKEEILTSLHLIKDIRRLETYQRDFFLKVSRIRQCTTYLYNISRALLVCRSRSL